MYYTGEGVLQDYTEAAGWYRKAADQGYMDAELYLGGMYYDGYGLPARTMQRPPAGTTRPQTKGTRELNTRSAGCTTTDEEWLRTVPRQIGGSTKPQLVAMRMPNVFWA